MSNVAMTPSKLWTSISRHCQWDQKSAHEATFYSNVPFLAQKSCGPQVEPKCSKSLQKQRFWISWDGGPNVVVTLIFFSSTPFIGEQKRKTALHVIVCDSENYMNRKMFWELFSWKIQFQLYETVFAEVHLTIISGWLPVRAQRLKKINRT